MTISKSNLGRSLEGSLGSVRRVGALSSPARHSDDRVSCVQVALPELDGGLEPIVFAGRDSNTGKSHSLPDRIDSLCNRAINWAM